MRLICPCCGWRDRREFTYMGADDYLHRPVPDAPPEAWDEYLHNRTNPAGAARDLWYHDPCGTWVCITRDTITHAVTDGTRLEDAQ
ncbi:MAG: sarcosine oxidase subunit delta [Rhodobacteraceae bacterium]|nr:sarcosine oxidase subunit delta [Paracoccaceae bacterium]